MRVLPSLIVELLSLPLFLFLPHPFILSIRGSLTSPLSVEKSGSLFLRVLVLLPSLLTPHPYPLQDEFSGVITRALSVLVLGLECRLDVELERMTRAPWAALETVGDQSE